LDSGLCLLIGRIERKGLTMKACGVSQRGWGRRPVGVARAAVRSLRPHRQSRTYPGHQRL